ncbi:potassium channel subfamily K member 18-like [Sarcoptes scabiei]|nr:potassium channel subfamily K member 18-like [Sarcoptes scabiei]
MGGSFMFHIWEGLSFLDGAYFCFVTLSTIGYGDILPEKTITSNQIESKKRIIIVVLYILGGMALVAMSFNLIYEQLALKFKKIGYRIQLQQRQSQNQNNGFHLEDNDPIHQQRFRSNTLKFFDDKGKDSSAMINSNSNANNKFQSSSTEDIDV